MVMNKIGIVTLVDNLNYGNRLQNFAVDSIYKRLGSTPITLVNEVIPVSVKVKGFVKGLLGMKEETASPEKDPRFPLFEKFNEPIRFEHVQSWRGLSDSYDLFSVGSDQIWNPYYTSDLRWPFLNFARREQRVALCPSIGIESIPDNYARIFKTGAQGFDVLSVREYAGKEILEIFECCEPVVLADPTIMLEPEDWLKVADCSVTPDEPYIFEYALGETDEARRRYVERLADGRRVIRLSDHSNDDGVLAGPSEFIDLIAHADFVVTDSFHGSVFSMLLDTPLTIVRRTGRGSELGSRIDTFVKKFGLEWALLENGGEASLEPEKKQEYLDRERLRYISYLAHWFDDDALDRLAKTIGLSIDRFGTKSNE